MRYIMPYDVTLTTCEGHTLALKKDEPTHVPPALIPLVMERGGRAEDPREPTPRATPDAPSALPAPMGTGSPTGSQILLPEASSTSPQSSSTLANVGTSPDQGGTPGTDSEAVQSAAPVNLSDTESRRQAIQEATQRIAVRNNRKDFGANGRPTVKALEAQTGFAVDVRERDRAWEDLTAKTNAQG